MAIVYNDDDVAVRKGGFGINDLDPVALYMKHAENWMYLHFIYMNTKDFSEKHQAGKEMKIAERKMDHWYRMLTPDQITAKLMQLKHKWNYEGKFHREII